MLDRSRGPHPAEDDYVEICITGARAAGEYHCSQCGYGITIHDALPVCPMCAGESWEPVPWSPFSRAVELSTHGQLL